jgi:hypothetical protein
VVAVVLVQHYLVLTRTAVAPIGADQPRLIKPRSRARWR